MRLALETERSCVWPWRPPSVCCSARCWTQGHAGSLPRSASLMAGPGGRAHLCLALETFVSLLRCSTLSPGACWQYLVQRPEPGGGELIYVWPLETELSYVWPWRPPTVCCGARCCAQYLGAEAMPRPGDRAQLCLALETPARLLLRSMHARGHADSFPRKVPLLGCRGWSPAGTTSFLCAFCLALQAALISVCPRRPPLLCCCARCCARGHAGSLPRRNFFLRAEPRARQGRTHSCLALKAEIRTVCVLIFARRARCHN